MAKMMGPGGLPPDMFGMQFMPKSYQNIAELLSVLANILVVGERSQDEDFRERYKKLFDIMFKGLAIYMDREFFNAGKGPNNTPVVLAIDKEKEVFKVKDRGEKNLDSNDFDLPSDDES